MRTFAGSLANIEISQMAKLKLPGVIVRPGMWHTTWTWIVKVVLYLDTGTGTQTPVVLINFTSLSRHALPIFLCFAPSFSSLSPFVRGPNLNHVEGKRFLCFRMCVNQVRPHGLEIDSCVFAQVIASSNYTLLLGCLTLPWKENIRYISGIPITDDCIVCNREQ